MEVAFRAARYQIGRLMSRRKRQLRQNAIPDAPTALRLAPWLRSLAAVMLVFAWLLVLYGPSLTGGILWDDNDNVTPPALRSWHGLERIWFQWGAAQTYYPLLHTTFWIEHRLWGDDTLGYHVANVLLHSISVVLLYWILRRLKIPGALLAAAVFAVHPVYVESVAWITEQKNTLSGMFYLGSQLAYLHFDDSRRRATYWLALALFVLSLLSKATAVTLPAALLVVLWWKRGTLSWRRDVAPLAPWFALSLLSGVFTVWYERVYIGAQGAAFNLSMVQKCLLACRAVCFYLSKLFWPARLTFIYPRWEVNPADPGQYLYVLGLIALFAAAWMVHRRWRGPLAALLIFVGALFPLLGFFNTFIFSFTYVCDHFQYLPSLGIVVLVAATATIAVERLPMPRRFIAQGASVLLTAVLAWLTWQRSHVYSDAVTLYENTIERNPNCWMAYNNMGVHFINSGLPQDAVDNFEHALRINPDYPEAHNNVGVVLGLEGRPEEAKQHYLEAIRIRPEYPDAHYNLALLLFNEGRMKEAIEQYELTLLYSPPNAKAHNNLGIVLKQTGAFQEAIEHFHRALEIEPDSFQPHYNLADTLMQLKRPQEALEQFQQALRYDPTDLDNIIGLATCYAVLHRSAEAVATAEKAQALARTQGQTEVAAKIDAWLTRYRSSQSSGPESVPHSESGAPQK